MTVVLRQARVTLEFPQDDGFARQLAALVRRRLPDGCSLGPGPLIALRRLPDGGWRLLAGAGEVAVDELALGAAAARHLAALGARELRYAGPAAEDLRRRGFAIAAGALGCACTGLDGPLLPGIGVFADGAEAESAALARLAQLPPRDGLLLGVDDGRLPAPRAPGLSRLRLDLAALADAAVALALDGGAGRRFVPPAGVIARGNPEAGSEDARLAAALAHLRAHLHRPLDVSDLAAAAGLPRRSLERMFRAALGRSPLDEIRRQRIVRAQELLAHSDLPLDEIAARTGFSGPDRLGVVFRQLAGVSPGAWRRGHGLQPGG